MEFLRAAQVFGGGGDIDDRAEFDRTGRNPDGKVIVAPAARQPSRPTVSKITGSTCPSCDSTNFRRDASATSFSFR